MKTNFVNETGYDEYVVYFWAKPYGRREKVIKVIVNDLRVNARKVMK